MIYENDRENDPCPECREGLPHGLALPSDRDLRPRRGLAESVDDPLHGGAGTSQIASATAQFTSITRWIV